MSEQSVYEKARAAFDEYAGIDPNAYEIPTTPGVDRVSVLAKFPLWRQLQIRLAAWKGRNFGASGNDAEGIGEELGEAALGLLGLMVGSGAILHASLKTEQKIRGFGDPEKGRQAVSDGLADVVIFSFQLATSMRLDFQTLIEETAKDVLRRDWVKNRTNANVVAEQPDAHCVTTPDGDCVSTDPLCMHQPAPDTAAILRKHDDALKLEEYKIKTGIETAACPIHNALTCCDWKGNPVDWDAFHAKQQAQPGGSFVKMAQAGEVPVKR